MQRRQFMQGAGAAALLAAGTGCATTGQTPRGNVVVVGGGYGGATAAKYLRMWSNGGLNVTLVEPNANFISCPLSNLVLGGSRQIADLTVPYDALVSRHGIKLVRDSVVGIDAAKRTVRLAGGQSLPYDRLILSPGIDLSYASMPGMASKAAQERVLHAWKAGPQTVALRRQLEAMPDGGVYAITIPTAPYRCPPGPYERACQVAHYFSRAKPRSKVLILDANADVTSKGALFKRVWAERYKGIVEYRPQFVTADVDANAGMAISEFGDRVKANVLNVVPPQLAGEIAAKSGLANMNRRWCEVDYLTFESTQAPGVHVIGDAIQVAPLMPKSGHMANQHGKVVAAAVVDLLNGVAPNPLPMMTNTCYSFTSDQQVIHVASVHRFDAAKKTFLTVPGSGGVSPAPSEQEGAYAMNWARNIWADSLM